MSHMFISSPQYWIKPDLYLYNHRFMGLLIIMHIHAREYILCLPSIAKLVQQPQVRSILQRMYQKAEDVCIV